MSTTEELIRLVEHARVGGMLGGKAGINIRWEMRKIRLAHYDAVAKSELKFTQFFPHIAPAIPTFLRMPKAMAKTDMSTLRPVLIPMTPKMKQNRLKPLWNW